ncbi:MAG: DUF2064 domain-containing protein [Elusimicrobia bacterium]|nr:DUF2064 domain-containing protein [Elusimicrobiota bacterium]
MKDKRNNSIILLAEAPEPGKTNCELKTSLGEERALHVSGDLLKNSYALAKNFKDAILLISYEKTPSHPDLTWLDPEDPGFLETNKKTAAEQLTDAFTLAFNTGAKKALFLNHLSPDVKPEWLSQAFDGAGEKTVSIGRNQDGSFYLLALTQNNLKIISGISPYAPSTADELSEKAKKNKLAVFTTPETFAVKNAETLSAWIEARKQESPLFSALQPPPEPGPASKHPKNHAGKNRRDASPEETEK